ncbi:MAG: ATP-binding protein [Oscillospiraceae bacterium]|nr:ATP-binding protein [Oscillospiraceae bacterium]
MNLDGKLLVKAKTKLEEKKQQHERLFEQRRSEAFAKSPRVYELDSLQRSLMIELVAAALGSGDISVDDIRQKSKKLYEEKKDELVKAGFRADYIDEVYLCEKCSDTGYENSKICSCLMDLYKDEQRKELSNLLKLGDETFDSFNITYYSDKPSTDTNISPRQSMEVVFETCKEYANKFNKKSNNLLFIGAPGLGKTFLSACIARVVADSGYSVAYDMAASIFARFEDAKFSRTDDLEEIRDEIKRYLECDLLIIDDLGTEMTTSFTISALYEIINTRLINNRKTLINTNLIIDEMRRRYTKQIMSRLEGEYLILTFFGDDIRRIKNAY